MRRFPHTSMLYLPINNDLKLILGRCNFFTPKPCFRDTKDFRLVDKAKGVMTIPFASSTSHFAPALTL